jgi:N-acetylmuramoyl-L-alanine amidase
MMEVSMRLRRATCAAIAATGLLSLGIGLAGQQQGPATPLRLVTPTAARPLPTILSNDVEMVALDDLATAFGLVVREDALARAVTVTWNGKTVVITPDQSLASVAGRLVSLPAAPSRIDGRLYVPLEFIARGLAPIAQARLELRKASRLVLFGAVRAPRVVVRHEAPGNQARLTFDISPPTPHTLVQEAGRLVLRFDAALVDAALPSFTSQGLVQALRTAESPPSIVVELGPRFGSFRAVDASSSGDTARLTIDVFGTTDQQTGAVPPPAPPAEAPLPLPAAAPGLRTIVIDAGHGGAEEGARGPKGTREKDVTLAVARRLKSSLEARLGGRVLLTREDDRAVALDERAALANNNKADLFVSLHANASVRAATNGAEVFYLSLERHDEEAQRIAQAERTAMPVFGGGSREIDVILWEMAQARYIDRSAAFARTLEDALRRTVPMSPRAIQQAPFRVLVGANMPAVLVEMGYLTNPEQEARLASGEFQGRLVQAIVDAIARFDQQVRSAVAVAGGTPVTP